MKDIIFKLMLLRNDLVECFGYWRDGIWERDLDSLYCCEGRECGCEGITIRELYTSINAKHRRAGE